MTFMLRLHVKCNFTAKLYKEVAEHGFNKAPPHYLARATVHCMNYIVGSDSQIWAILNHSIGILRTEENLWKKTSFSNSAMWKMLIKGFKIGEEQNFKTILL